MKDERSAMDKKWFPDGRVSLQDATMAVAAPLAEVPEHIARLREQMAGVKGQAALMKKLEEMVSDGVYAKARDKRLGMPRTQKNRNMIFGGPSGTGKTTTALALADVFYESGLLKNNVVKLLRGNDVLHNPLKDLTNL